VACAIAEATFTAADRAYLRAEFVTLDELCSSRRESPDDRAAEWNDRPPTRDLLIAEARRRFPEVFATG
jgi:hypothetical protein